MKKKEGDVIILSAPSGTGKTTICNMLKVKAPNIQFSISHTSREPREGEQDGVDYHFITEEDFQNKIEDDDFLEWARIHDFYYGTTLEVVNRLKEQGSTQIMELDTQGVESLRTMDFKAVYIFILPPSLKDLEKRLIKRGSEPLHKIKERIEVGKREIMKYTLYDYVVTNMEVDETVSIIQSIIRAEEYRTARFLPN